MDAEHDWHTPKMPSWDTKYQACRKCGIIKRADGKNKPCKGVVRITLR